MAPASTASRSRREAWVADASAEDLDQFFPWDETLATGNAMIDADHRRLVDFVNDLHAAMRDSRGTEAIGGILAGLVTYTREHFAREQQFMDPAVYPDRDRHLQAHADFIARIEEFGRR